MATHNLDVAFSSDVTPNDSSQPIAMAYGYTDDTHGGSFRGQGQRKEKVRPGAKVNFWVYDTASSPTTVLSVQISAVNSSQGTAKSPFTDAAWSNGSVTAVPDPSPNSNQLKLNGPNAGASSTGCNIKNSTSWGPLGAFTVGEYEGQRFEFTVTVLTQKGQTQQSFIVDPEMAVGTEGK